MNRYTVRDLDLRLWQIFVILFPLYLLPSGMPRISDFFIVAILVRIAWRREFPILRSSRHIIGALFVFVAYAFAVNAFYALKYIDPKFLLSGMYYLYNAVYFSVAISLYTRYGDRFLTATLNALTLSLVWQIPFIMRSEDGADSLRKTIFFNNPNQLGYFALLAMTLLLLIGRVTRVPIWQVILIVTISTAFSMVALSKAALVGTAVLGAFLALSHMRGAVLVALAVAAAISITPMGAQATENVRLRISAFNQYDDNAEARGYDRMTEYPQYLAFGSGEAGYARFIKFGNRELHSVFGTLLFAYGIVGFALAMLFLGLVCQPQGVYALSLLPIAAYGVTHQGLRFTLLWGVLAISWCVWHAGRTTVPIRTWRAA